MRPILLFLALAACTADDDPIETGETGEVDPGPSEPSILGASGVNACAMAPDALRCWGDGASVHRVPDVDDDATVLAVSGDQSCWLNSAGEVWCTGSAEPTRKVEAGLHVRGGEDGFCAVNGFRRAECWDRVDGTPAEVANTVGASRAYARAGTDEWSLVEANGIIQTWTWGGDAVFNDVLRANEELAMGPDHGCSRITSTAAVCWGSDALGQTGVEGSGTLDEGDRVTVFEDSVQQIVGGLNHVCVLLDDGSVHCWGDNSRGQLGRGAVGTPAIGPTPNAVPGLTDVLELAAGDDFTCAALPDASVRCWGAGSEGQLGGSEDRGEPIVVIAPAG
ncbi:MAG: hypothetical protein EP330_01990 [Deltaproteobacteria bacterium]|nr:MAG: hypothetical protein EP330_01990 [Deltaproteobacteria bacterium]